MKKEQVCSCYACDKCGELARTGERWRVSFFSDEKIMYSEMKEAGWHQIDGKWYCPDCCSWDEEEKKWVVKKRWKPDEGDEFYFVDWDHCEMVFYVDSVCYHSTSERSLACYRSGNCFETPVEAHLFCDQLSKATCDILK